MMLTVILNLSVTKTLTNHFIIHQQTNSSLNLPAFLFTEYFTQIYTLAAIGVVRMICAVLFTHYISIRIDLVWPVAIDSALSKIHLIHLYGQ